MSDESYDFEQSYEPEAQDTDPVSVMKLIAADCRALDAVGKALGTKLKQLANAEIQYGDALDAALIDADGSSKEKREAQARQKVDAELRGRVARLKRETDALRDYARIKGNTLSGRQSVLSSLRDEQRGQQGAQPHWTGPMRSAA